MSAGSQVRGRSIVAEDRSAQAVRRTRNHGRDYTTWTVAAVFLLLCLVASFMYSRHWSLQTVAAAPPALAPPVQAQATTPTHSEAVVDATLEFNPTDYNETFMWWVTEGQVKFLAEQKQYEPLYNSNRVAFQVEYESHMQRVQDELKQLIGQEVAWRLPIAGIRGRSPRDSFVDIASYPGGGRPQVTLQKSSWQLGPSGPWNTPIGGLDVMNLRVGKLVTVHARIGEVGVTDNGVLILSVAKNSVHLE